jgi:predicted alpha/beta-hydrolase family hydrolase
MSSAEIQKYERDSAGGAPPVSGYLHIPAKASGAGLVLTHGAGTNCEAPLLSALAEAICDLGFTVLRCDLAFRQTRPNGPPPRGSAERDQAGQRAAVESLRKLVSGSIFLGGHSYGGRQASILAATDPELAEGLLLLSYPLHPPDKPAQLRTAHFPKIKTPSLFVHGTKDSFGTTDEFAAAISQISARTQLLDIQGAEHSLLTKRNRTELPLQIAKAFDLFFNEV